MDLKKEIQKLIELQEIDGKIISCKKDRDFTKPQLIAEITAAFEEKRNITRQAEEELKNLQIIKKQKELDLQTKEEAIKKNQAQLFQLKTNQEYQAKIKEINSLKADVSVKEEEILQVMEDIDAAVKKLEERKSLVSRQEVEFKQEKSKIEEEIKQVEAEINHLQGKRDILAKEIEPDLLQKYEYLLENRSGLAIVGVKSGVCQGCYMSVTDEVINQMKLYKEVMTCPMCARMIYPQEDFS